MAFEEINKPTNIDRVTDLIDLDVEAGQEVEIDAPVPENGDVEVNFAQDGSAVLDYMPDDASICRDAQWRERCFMDISGQMQHQLIVLLV